jgi:hypothetical protein
MRGSREEEARLENPQIPLHDKNSPSPSIDVY